MDRVLNPYSPGAGTPPPALVGRERQLKSMDVTLRRALAGKPIRPPLLVGLRGVGKTVLLHEFVRRSRAAGYLTAEVEVDERGDFPSRVAGEIRRALFDLSLRYKVGDLVARALGVLKAFTIRWPGGPDLRIDVDVVAGPADSGNLGADLAGLLTAVGQVARQAGTGLCLTVDEVQYLGVGDLSEFVMSLHRVSQESLPVVACLAGLPSVFGLVGDAKSYAERLFEFEEIGSLSPHDARDAVVVPAKAEGVEWEDRALDHLFTMSAGYPFFIQQFASQTWDVAVGPTAILDGDVATAETVAIHELDSGFFRVRFDRTTDGERAYLKAMAHLGPGPYSSPAIAAALGKNSRQLGPIRARLIHGGLCYAPRWGELAFTVPKFDEFLRRAMP